MADIAPVPPKQGYLLVTPIDLEGNVIGGGGGDSAAIGTPSDAPWTGTRDGTVIAILKGIFNNTSGG